METFYTFSLLIDPHVPWADFSSKPTQTMGYKGYL